MEINSQITHGTKVRSFDEKVIKNEPMLFNCDWWAAYEMGGDPTKEFLLSLPSHVQNHSTIIDSRVHMLMPGWHHDDVPRGIDGQPNYYNPEYRSQHAMVLYNGDICPTEFAVGKAEFSNPEFHPIVYKAWHKEVEHNLEHMQLSHVLAPSNQIIYFDDRTWHQGTAAKKGGWRFIYKSFMEYT